MKRAVEAVKKYIIANLLLILVLTASVAIVSSLLLYRNNSLVPVAPVEVMARSSADSINKIIDNPINAPYKLTRYASHKINNSLGAERAIGAAVAGLSIMLFFVFSRQFASKEAAILATILYATSSTLLNNARLATPNVMLLSLFILVASGFILRASKNITAKWLILCFIASLSLYTPAMIYFVFIGAVVFARYYKEIEAMPKRKVLAACCFISALILLPLVYGFMREPTLLREYLAMPAGLPSLINFSKAILAVPLGLIVKAPINPVYRLATQPALDALTATLFIFGCVSVAKQYKLKRLYIFGGIFALATIFTAASANYENSFILLPFVYLFVAGGIEYLLDSWKVIFPHNPFAKSLSLVILVFATAVSVNFQITRYYVAWPHNTSVKAEFNKSSK